MKKQIVYADEEIGDLEVIEDFLPAPDQLAYKEDNVKVTISLSRSSVDFFKKEAKLHNTQYQRMIRRLLDYYASRNRELASTKASSVRGKPRR